MQINLNTDNFWCADCNVSYTAGHIIYQTQEYIAKSNMEEIALTKIFYDRCVKPWLLVEFLSTLYCRRKPTQIMQMFVYPKGKQLILLCQASGSLVIVNADQCLTVPTEIINFDLIPDVLLWTMVFRRVYIMELTVTLNCSIHEI